MGLSLAQAKKERLGVIFLAPPALEPSSRTKLSGGLWGLLVHGWVVIREPHLKQELFFPRLFPTALRISQELAERERKKLASLEIEGKQQNSLKYMNLRQLRIVDVEGPISCRKSVLHRGFDQHPNPTSSERVNLEPYIAIDGSLIDFQIESIISVSRW